MDPLVPVDIMGEDTAQTDGTVQRGLIEGDSALVAGERLSLTGLTQALHHRPGEERDTRWLPQSPLLDTAEGLQAPEQLKDSNRLQDALVVLQQAALGNAGP